MPALRPARGVVRAATAALVPALLLAGCSGEEDGGAADSTRATDLLTAAKKALDGTSSVHFALTSQDVPDGGTRLVGGDGVAARPASFQGKLAVLIGGNRVSVDLVSTGGQVYAKLPFAQAFAPTDPADFGLRDPAALMDPETGISTIAAEMTGETVVREARIGGEVVVEITGRVPGEVVERTLTSADPATPVAATVFVAQESGQLRRAELTGPFFEAGTDSTFTVVLDRYGEKVTISAPPTG